MNLPYSKIGAHFAETFIINVEEIPDIFVMFRGNTTNEIWISLAIGWLFSIMVARGTKTRRPASTGIFFAQLQIFWSTFANGWKENNCLDISFQRVFTNINSTTDFCTLCKRVSRFSVEKFLSHSAEKFRRGSLLCFRKFLVSKNVRDKRERAGGYQDFPSKTFCLTLPFIVVEPFIVSLISSIEKC